MGRLGFLLGALAVLRLLGHFTDPILTSAEIHRIVGEPSRVAAKERPGRLRMATWNVEQGKRFDEIAHALRRMDVDVILLQEADIACRRSGNRNVPRDLAHLLEMNWIAAGEFQEIGESTGGLPALTTQAMLSRYPISDASVIRFADQSLLRWWLSPVQPRRGARIALEARTAGVRFYNAHIESGGSERLRTNQMRQILNDHADSRAEGGAVVAGDFNNIPAAMSPMFPALEERGFVNALEGALPARTSAGNAHPIDWIFVRGLTADGFVLDTGEASDHFPVVAELREEASRRDGRERSLHTETTRTP